MWKPISSGGAWSVAREYVWLDGRPLAQVEYPGPSGGNEGYVYLVHVDHLGQPRALTSTTGAVVWSSTPRAYGEIRETTTPDPANGRTIVTNLRLPGQYDERLLGAIGLSGPYYNGARWYLPAMARYLEPDPVALAGGLNGKFAPDWYGYANQNPLRWTDPTGRIGIVGVAIGAVAGGIAGYAATGNWKGAAIGAVVGGAVGIFAPLAATSAAGLVTNELLGYAAATAADIGVNAVGGGAAAIASSYIMEGEVDWRGVGLGAGIGALVPVFTGEALAAGVAEEAGLAGEIAWGVNGGGLGIVGSLLDPKSPYTVKPENSEFKPWQDSGTAADRLRAAGCKP